MRYTFRFDSDRDKPIAIFIRLYLEDFFKSYDWRGEVIVDAVGDNTCYITVRGTQLMCISYHVPCVEVEEYSTRATSKYLVNNFDLTDPSNEQVFVDFVKSAFNDLRRKHEVKRVWLNE